MTCEIDGGPSVFNSNSERISVNSSAELAIFLAFVASIFVAPAGRVGVGKLTPLLLPPPPPPHALNVTIIN